MKHKHIGKLLLYPALALLLANNLLQAAPAEIGAAVERYKAGHPDQAIELLRPLAAAGDADAQYLLGNIIYGLAESTDLADTADAITWYRMAASRDHAQASYALGVIYANQWRKSKDPQHAGIAEAWYQKAADLGYEPALGQLMQLAARDRSNPPAGKSLTYTNSSFSSSRDTGNNGETGSNRLEQPESASPGAQAISELDNIGDPVAEANKLIQLIDLLKSIQ